MNTFYPKAQKLLSQLIGCKRKQSCKKSISYLHFASLCSHMKYVGEKQVMSVKNFFLERSGIKNLAKNEAFATISSSGCDFFCNFSIKRKVSAEFVEKEMWK